MKKLIALITVMMLLWVNVSAAIVFEEDFTENPLPSEMSFGNDGRGSGSNDRWSVSCHKDYPAHEVSEGTMKIKREDGVTLSSRVDITAKFPELDWEDGETVVMFDMKTGNMAKYATMNLFCKYDINGTLMQDRVQAYIYSKTEGGQNSGTFKVALRTDPSETSKKDYGIDFTPNTWTTFAIKSKIVDDVWSLKFFVKKEGETEFTPYQEGKTFYAPPGNLRNAIASANTMAFISADSVMDLEVDNIKIYNNTAVTESGFEFNGEALDDLGEIGDYGEIEASATVFDATADPSENANSVQLFTVALDKNMKMIDCVMQESQLKVGQNTLTGVIEVSDNPEDRNYFGNFEGGMVQFFLWNKYQQPLGDALELR